MSNTPHLKLRAYPLTLTIWKKINDAGFPYYTHELTGKAYKDDAGEWQNWPVSDHDWPKAALLYTKAFNDLKIEQIHQEAIDPGFAPKPKVTAANVENPF